MVTALTSASEREFPTCARPRVADFPLMPLRAEKGYSPRHTKRITTYLSYAKTYKRKDAATSTYSTYLGFVR